MAHLKIETISLAEVKEKTAVIQFNVTWEDGWKNDINCDGIWVFGKFRVGQGLWRHISLNAASDNDFNYEDQTPAGFSQGSDGTSSEMGMWIPYHQKGAFIFRTDGEGDVRSNNIKLVWNFDNDELTESDMKNVEIKIFGLEMVYVPEGEHYVGDPLGTNGPKNCLYTYPDGGAYLVDSEEEILVDAQDGCLYCDQDNERSRDDVPLTIPETFPKGYKAFWYMKYGVNSQQYVDFLNTLTRKQQQTHIRSDISNDEIPNYHVMTNSAEEHLRQSIVCHKKGNGTETPVTFFTYAPARACNAIAWRDTAAFAAWAALRPITDFEFEKACRGPEEAVAWECAWGSDDIGRADTFDGCDGCGYEKKIPTSGLVNACYGGGIAPFDAAAGKTEPDNPGFVGPVSIGLFANSRHEGIPKRLNDGASYYGIMELSGNLWEPIVTFGSPKGRAFKVIHGDGYLDEDGFARVDGWPQEDGEGTGVRGGVYRSPDASYLAVALRFAGCHAKADPRYNGGIRIGF
jgi:hypothetical protein